MSESIGSTETQLSPKGQTLPACPWWCASRNPDHGREIDSVDDKDDSIGYRTHVLAFGDSVVAIVQDERHQAGAVILEPAEIRIYEDAAKTPEEAERLATALRDAKALFGQISRDARAAELPIGAPQPGPCPSWCEKRHEHPSGWDEIEIGRGVVHSLTKWCAGYVTTVETEDGGLPVLVRQTADSDFIDGRWTEIHLGKPVVEMHMPTEFVLTDASQTAALRAALDEAEQRLRAAA